MRAVEVREPGGPLELVERAIPEPGRGDVRLRVQACGVCHSDSLTKVGGYPWVTYPRVPGHEVAGTIDAVGEGVRGWEVGQRVGVGWYGGHCGHCEPCRRGDFIWCLNGEVPGVTIDGGYADYLVVSATALARIPDDLRAQDAAPLLCAGVSTYAALRDSGARPGDLVAVLGIGGVGHLAVQFAARQGFETVAIARGRDKEAAARTLGAHHYVDSTTHDVAAALLDLGGARVVLATVTSASAMSAAFGGLGRRGRLIILGISDEPLQISPMQLLRGGGRTVCGHCVGTSMDSQDALGFSALSGVRPVIETLPLERAAAAYDRMMSGDARFRVVLTTDG